MLYVTTRNNRDAFTAQRVLRESRGADGGLYLPFRFPNFSSEEIEALAEKPFNQRIADILNTLFNTKLTSWDVDFCIGRFPVRLVMLGNRIVMGECWHNPDGDYKRLVKNLSTRLCEEACIPGNWVAIAVRIAVLFGIFGELRRNGIETADISVVSGDFSAPISAWYARAFGLPIGNIVCCCNENKNLWDLICHGQMRTDTVSISTAVPEADITLPDHLERLIYACGGVAEVNRYLETCRRGGVYSVGEPMLSKLRDGQYVSVASTQRMETTIPSVYRTHGYLLSPASALAYAGLLDYRAKTGITRHALILTDQNPAADGETAARLLGISPEELKDYL